MHEGRRATGQARNHLLHIEGPAKPARSLHRAELNSTSTPTWSRPHSAACTCQPPSVPAGTAARPLLYVLAGQAPPKCMLPTA